MRSPPHVKMHQFDPCEMVILDALEASGERVVPESQNPTHMDFYLPRVDVHIEVKQYHSPRIEAQMARADNVIAVQGIEAARWLADLIRRNAL